MSSNDTFRLATIGTGGISRAHRRSYSELKSAGLAGFTVTAVCDTNEERARAAAQECEERFGIRPAVYTDHQELLSKEQIDGADLCLPHGVHHSVAIECMEAGVPVLCEKPLGITVKATRKMAEAAERTGCILATAHQSRRGPAQRATRWLFSESKLIGEPLTFFHQVALAVPRGGGDGRTEMPWPERRVISGGQPAFACGVHYFDSMFHLFGDLEKVYAEVRGLATGTPKMVDEAPEDAVHAVLTFKSGLVGTWSYWLSAPGESSTNVMFYGSEGSLRDAGEGLYRCWCHLFSGLRGALPTGRLIKRDGTELSMEELHRIHLQALSEKEREFLFPHGVTSPMALEIWDFIEAARGNREKAEVDGWAGLKAVAASHAVYESAVSGEAVYMDDVLSGKVCVYQAAIDEYWNI